MWSNYSQNLGEKKKQDIPGANTFEASTSQPEKSLRVFSFFKISNFSKLKKFRPRFFLCSSTKKSTAQNWPRVGPKQMAAWEKYFNSFKPKFLSLLAFQVVSLRIRVWYIYLYIWLVFMEGVGKYTIHGSYGFCLASDWTQNQWKVIKPTWTLCGNPWARKTWRKTHEIQRCIVCHMFLVGEF